MFLSRLKIPKITWNQSILNTKAHDGASSDQASGLVNGMIQSTLSRHANEGGNMKSILAEESKKVNVDLGIGRRPRPPRPPVD